MDILINDLLARLSYDPITGVFIWKAKEINHWTDKSFNTIYAGKQAGILNPINGYRYIALRINRKRRNFYEHRLAFLFMTGDWPKYEVNHLDRNKQNNVWTNLEDTTHSSNELHKYSSPDGDLIRAKMSASRYKAWDKYGNNWDIHYFGRKGD